MMRTTLREVTRNEAEEWLGSFRNRKLRQHVVKQLWRDMSSGNWRVTHQSIAIDTHGRCIDGQHRLMAFLETTEDQFLTLVTTGCDPDSFNFLDSGKVRNAADSVYIAGFDRAPTLIAAVVALHMRTRHHADYRVMTKPETRALAVSVAQRYPTIVDASIRVESREHAAFRGWLQPSPAALVLAWAMLHDTDLADEWFDGLAHGTGLTDGDPRLSARTALNTRALRSGEPANRTIQLLTLARSWNAYAQGRKLHKIMIRDRRGDGETYDIPRIIGEPEDPMLGGV